MPMQLHQTDYKQRLAACLYKWSYSTKATAVEENANEAIDILNELCRRQKFYVALAGLHEKHLMMLIKFLAQRMCDGDGKSFDVLFEATNVLIHLYGEEKKLEDRVMEAFRHLKACVDDEVQTQKSMCKTLGATHALLSASILLKCKKEGGMEIKVEEEEE